MDTEMGVVTDLAVAVVGGLIVLLVEWLGLRKRDDDARPGGDVTQTQSAHGTGNYQSIGPVNSPTTHIINNRIVMHPNADSDGPWDLVISLIVIVAVITAAATEYRWLIFLLIGAFLASIVFYSISALRAARRKYFLSLSILAVVGLILALRSPFVRVGEYTLQKIGEALSKEPSWGDKIQVLFNPIVLPAATALLLQILLALLMLAWLVYAPWAMSLHRGPEERGQQVFFWVCTGLLVTLGISAIPGWLAHQLYGLLSADFGPY